MPQPINYEKLTDDELNYRADVLGDEKAIAERERRQGGAAAQEIPAQAGSELYDLGTGKLYRLVYTGKGTLEAHELIVDSNGNPIGMMAKAEPVTGRKWVDPATRQYFNIANTGQPQASGKLTDDDLARLFGIAGTGAAGAGGAAYVPDYIGAANAIMRFYEDQVAAGQIPHQEALNQMEADLNRLEAQRREYELQTRTQEAAARRGIDIADIATTRGRILAQDIFPRALPQSSINIPFFGAMQGIPVNTATFFSQQETPLQASVPGITQYMPQTIPPVTLPKTVLPPMPDIHKFIAAETGM